MDRGRGGELQRDDQTAGRSPANFYMTPYGTPYPSYTPPRTPQAGGPQAGPGRTPIVPGMSVPQPGAYTSTGTGTGYDGLASQSWTPTPGKLPPQRAPGSIILQDSNPVRYSQPRAGGFQNPAPGRLSEVIGGNGNFPGGSQQQGGSGAILGSSAGPPAFYGAGLAPASGLGGGLYPSLLSLYR